MSPRQRLFWRVGAAIYVVVNVGGLVFAAVMGEPMHAVSHIVALLAGAAAYNFWGPRGRAPAQEVAGLQQASRSIDHLQQSVDAIALEVERISEAQRFEARLLEERGLHVPQQKKEQ